MSRPSTPLAEAPADLSLSCPVPSAASDSAASSGPPSFVSLLHRDALVAVFSMLHLDELSACDFTSRQWHLAARVEANGRAVREQAREKQALYDQSHLDELWTQMQDDSAAVMLTAAARLRHLLTATERVVHVMSALGPGRLRQLVQWMDQSDEQPTLQHEYLWACLNCAASVRTDLIVEQGAIPVLVRLLRSPHISIREQALWACANVAGDNNVEFRDELLSLGALPLVLEFARNPQSGRVGALTDAAWFCSMLFRNTPQADFDEFAPPVMNLLTSLMRRTEIQLLVRVCNGFADLCRDNTDDNRQIGEVVSTPGVAARIVELLLSAESTKLQKAALEAVSHILSGTADQSQRLIDVGVLPALKRVLSSPVMSHRKAACFSLANLMANTHEQTVTAFDAGVLEPICRMLQTDVLNVQYECAFCVSNAITVPENAPQIARWAAEHGQVLQSLCAWLPAFEADAIRVSLLAIKQILTVGRDDATAKRGTGSSNVEGSAVSLNAYAAIMDQCNGWTLVSPNLQHQRLAIALLAQEVMAFRCE